MMRLIYTICSKNSLIFSAIDEKFIRCKEAKVFGKKSFICFRFKKFWDLELPRKFSRDDSGRNYYIKMLETKFSQF